MVCSLKTEEWVPIESSPFPAAIHHVSDLRYRQHGNNEYRNLIFLSALTKVVITFKGDKGVANIIG